MKIDLIINIIKAKLKRELIDVKVYVVFSEYHDITAIEKIYNKEQDAIDFCNLMNTKFFGVWHYEEYELE